MDRRKPYDEVTIKLRKEGYGYSDIARMTGRERKSVKITCQRLGIEMTDSEKRITQVRGRFKPSVNWQERVDKYYNGSGIAEVLSVDRTNSGESRLTIKCMTCGNVRTLFSSTLRHSHNGYCGICRKKRKFNERLDKLETREREKRHNQKIKQLSFHTCRHCGVIIPFNRSVCDKCKREVIKENYRQKDIRRRSKLLKVRRDRDINLRKLYDRDNGICYLCGKACDFNDSKYVNGAFIVGNNYPTVEHIKPISLGGSDTWDNIKLACLYCNSKKGNSEAV